MSLKHKLAKALRSRGAKIIAILLVLNEIRGAIIVASYLYSTGGKLIPLF